MSGFSEQWLTLREPYDVAARNGKVLDSVSAAFAGHDSINVVDLACGTGSTFRSVSVVLPPRQNWRLVDNDLSLLARAKPAAASSDINVTTVPIDLQRDLELVLDGAVDLVATSAFLDLVSEQWLERLITEIAARRLPLYAAINYDGRASCEPVDEFDETIIGAVNKHQLTDKGFGPSLGPGAVGMALSLLKRLDYQVTLGPSDWVLGRSDGEMQTEILSGWAGAAREMDDAAVSAIGAWLARRRALVSTGRASMRVGHVDFFARPPKFR
jgi:SAM-dependent methyltransferase